MVRRLSRISSNPVFYTRVVGPLAVAYGLGLLATGYLRLEHVIIFSVWLLLTYVPRWRPFMLGFLPFFLFGLLYDALRFIIPPLHQVIPPHVVGPYQLEQTLFGWREPNGQIIIPTEALARVDSAGLLCLSAFAFFFYIYETFILAVVLSFGHRAILRRLGWAFFVVNVMGVLTYLLYPAAPPWYVLTHGLGPADLTTVSNPARLTQFDALLGVPVFGTIYARSSDVFGALPSLHAAYPLIAWLYTRHLSIGRWHWLFFVFWLLVSFAAVFLGHHYVIDVVLGWAYATVTYLATEELLYRRWPEAAPVGASSEAA